MKPNTGDNRLEITEAIGAQAARVTLSGELDISVVERLHEHLQVFAKAGTAVVLDISQLEFIDSSGLTVLVDCYRAARDEGRQLSIEPNMSEPVERVMKLSGLDSFFWNEHVSG